MKGGLRRSLCSTCSEERVRNGAKKLRKSREGATQGRLDSFFKPAATTSSGAVKRQVRYHSHTGGNATPHALTQGTEGAKGPLKKKAKTSKPAASKFKRK